MVVQKDIFDTRDSNQKKKNRQFSFGFKNKYKIDKKTGVK